MKNLFVVLIFVLVLAACAPVETPALEAGDLAFYAPYISAPGSDVAGGFVRIKNNGDSADRLIGAYAAVAETTEIHETSMDGGVMSMREVAAIEVPAGGEVALQHGGYHIMLINLTRSLTPGETVEVMLIFEQAGEVLVPMEVKAP